MNPRQAALALPPLARDPVETFVAGPGTAAVRRVLADWERWPTGALAVVAPRDSGKSHLAAVWAREAGAVVRGPLALRGAADAVREKLGGAPIVIDGIGEREVDDEGLMAVLDAARDRRGPPVALFARREPTSWICRRADLPSRLSVVPSVAFDPPDEAELSQILHKLFADRGLPADAALTDYLIARIERATPAAVAVVEAIDRLVWEKQAPLTRRLAGAALTGRGDDEPLDAHFD